MSFKFDYSSMENLEHLLDASQAWTQTYQFLQKMPHMESWEIKLIDDLIQSEKVFDV